MGDIEKKLKTQSDMDKKSSGNLINDKRANQSFHSSEDVGVIEVNWKGLYQDCKYAWITVALFMLSMLYGVWSLSSKGYFESRKIDEEMTKVKVLEVTNYFGKKILISGEITNNIPIEVRLPQKCVVDPRWIGKEIELKAERFQSNQTKIASFSFTGVENLCDSTDGYLKAKEEHEKMKLLVNKISTYDLIPDYHDEKVDSEIKVPTKTKENVEDKENVIQKENHISQTVNETKLNVKIEPKKEKIAKNNV